MVCGKMCACMYYADRTGVLWMEAYRITIQTGWRDGLKNFVRENARQFCRIADGASA